MTQQDSQLFWESHPSFPNETAEAFLKRHRREFDFVFSDDLCGKDVLNVGCDVGKETVLACLEGANVTAIDFTHTGIEMTRELLKKHGLTARLEYCNAEELTFPNDSFDFVFSLGVIHHTFNPDKVVDEVYRVLKPHGTFVLMLYNKEMPKLKKLVYGVPFDKQQWDGGCPIVNFYNLDGLKKLLHKFKIVKVKRFCGFVNSGMLCWVLRFSGFERFLGWWYVRCLKE